MKNTPWSSALANDLISSVLQIIVSPTFLAIATETIKTALHIITSKYDHTNDTIAIYVLFAFSLHGNFTIHCEQPMMRWGRWWWRCCNKKKGRGLVFSFFHFVLRPGSFVLCIVCCSRWSLWDPLEVACGKQPKGEAGKFHLGIVTMQYDTCRHILKIVAHAVKMVVSIQRQPYRGQGQQENILWPLPHPSSLQSWYLRSIWNCLWHLLNTYQVFKSGASLCGA